MAVHPPLSFHIVSKVYVFCILYSIKKFKVYYVLYVGSNSVFCTLYSFMYPLSVLLEVAKKPDLRGPQAKLGTAEEVRGLLRGK